MEDSFKKIINLFIYLFLLLYYTNGYSNTRDTIIFNKLYDIADSLRHKDSKRAIIYLDSLDNYLEHYEMDKMQWKSYFMRADIYKYSNDYEQSIKLFKNAEDIAKNISDFDAVLTIRSNHASVLWKMGKDSLALDQFNEILIEAANTALKNNKLKAYVYYHKAMIYEGHNDSLTIVNLLEAEHYAKISTDSKILGNIYYTLAHRYKDLANYDNSNKYYEKAESFMGNNNRHVIALYNSWASMLCMIDKYSEAEKIFTKALALPFIRNRDKVYLYNSMGIMYKDLDQFENCEKTLLLGLETAKKTKGLENKIAQLNANLGGLYFDFKKFPNSIKYFNLAREYYESNGSLENQTYLFESILKAQLNVSDANSLNVLDKYITLNDSIISLSKSSINAELLEKYQSKQKQAENDKLVIQQKLKETTISKQTNMLWGGGVGLGLLGLLSFLLFRQSNKQKRANLKLSQQRDQIKLLNREINHRVKNNLAFMTSLLEMQGRRTDTPEAKQVLKESESRLKALSLVHSNLFKNEQDIEINLGSYLEEISSHLQNIFELPNKALHIDYNFVEYTVDAEDAMRIGLILNESVTNSIKHAFNNIENPKIWISTSIDENGKLTLIYKDNGPGIQESILHEGVTTSKSMGHKLIQLLVKQLKAELYVNNNQVVISI